MAGKTLRLFFAADPKTGEELAPDTIAEEVGFKGDAPEFCIGDDGRLYLTGLDTGGRLAIPADKAEPRWIKRTPELTKQVLRMAWRVFALLRKNGFTQDALDSTVREFDRFYKWCRALYPKEGMMLCQAFIRQGGIIVKEKPEKREKSCRQAYSDYMSLYNLYGKAEGGDESAAQNILSRAKQEGFCAEVAKTALMLLGRNAEEVTKEVAA